MERRRGDALDRELEIAERERAVRAGAAAVEQRGQEIAQREQNWATELQGKIATCEAVCELADAVTKASQTFPDRLIEQMT